MKKSEIIFKVNIQISFAFKISCSFFLIFFFSLIYISILFLLLFFMFFNFFLAVSAFIYFFILYYKFTFNGFFIACWGSLFQHIINVFLFYSFRWFIMEQKNTWYALFVRIKSRRNHDIYTMWIFCFSSIIHILIDFGYNCCYALSLSHSHSFPNQFPGPNQERTRPTAVVRLHNVSLCTCCYWYTLLYIYTYTIYMCTSIYDLQSPDYESDWNKNVVECECSARNN